MSSVKAIIRKDKMNARGLAPVYLRTIRNRKAKYIRVDGVFVHPDDWDEKAECVKKSKRVSNYVRLNNLITAQKAKVQDYFIDISDGVRKYNPDQLKSTLTGYSRESFTKYAEAYVESLVTVGNYRMYKKMQSILTKLHDYAGKELKFADIDIDFLKAYEKYLREEKHNATNTILGNYKMIRKLFNDAIREDLIPAELYPFRKYRFKFEQPRIEYLTENELQAIENLELPVNTNIWHTRNLYVFACYAGGIRLGDLLALTWDRITETHLKLMTQKTDTQLDLALPRKAKEILALYKGSARSDTDFVFPFLKKRSKSNILVQRIESKNALINSLLKEIAVLAGITKRLHFHTSRHTFAVRALRRGINIYELSKIMTHSSIKITEIYLNIANEDLDRAMSEAFD